MWQSHNSYLGSSISVYGTHPTVLRRFFLSGCYVQSSATVREPTLLFPSHRVLHAIIGSRMFQSSHQMQGEGRFFAQPGQRQVLGVAPTVQPVSKRALLSGP